MEVEPQCGYTLFVDEAGDTGLDRVVPIDNSGGSEWFVIAGVLVRKDFENQTPNWIENSLRAIGSFQRRDLHYKDISASKHITVARILSNIPARYFVILSNKRNIRGYNNVRVEQGSYSLQWYYNWCLRLLVERSSDFVRADSLARYGSIKKMKLVLGRTGGHSYSQTMAYFEKLKLQSRNRTTFISTREIIWEVIDRSLIQHVPTKLTPGVQVADFVASSFYRTANGGDNFHYSLEVTKSIKRLIAKDNSKGTTTFGARNYGFTLFPQNYFRGRIPEQQSQLFRLFGYIA